jgi:hypothetical protein
VIGSRASQFGTNDSQITGIEAGREFHLPLPHDDFRSIRGNFELSPNEIDLSD